MEQQPADAAAKAALFASGLRKNVAAAGRRWTQWPGGAAHLARAIACIESIRERLQATGIDADEVAACIADLRLILEWATYQSASLATARAIVFARKTGAFAKRFGLLDLRDANLSVLGSSESALIANVAERNGHMLELAERRPQLTLPPPLIDAASLGPKAEKKPGKLDLIARLQKSAAAKPGKT